MIFRKNVEPACIYCRHSREAEEDAYICTRRGIVSPWSSCRRFSYDPLRRIPETAPAPVSEGLDPDDFKLE